MQDFKKLDALAKLMAQRDYLVKKRKLIAEELNTLSLDEIRFQSELKKETHDYVEIEKLSIKQLLELFSDQYEEMMDQEYREMKIAEYKHTTLLSQMRSSQDEILNITELLKGYDDIDDAYNALLGAKRNWAAERGVTIIETYEREMRFVQSRQKEIEEALSASKRLVLSLNTAVENLSSAKSWGLFDILRGGSISNEVKNDYIKRASQFILDSSEKAKLLSRELKDLAPLFDAEILTINLLSKMFDMFFDNILSDLAIQEQIDSAYETLCTHHTQAQSLQGRLEALNIDNTERLESTTKKRNEVLLSL